MKSESVIRYDVNIKGTCEGVKGMVQLGDALAGVRSGICNHACNISQCHFCNSKILT